MSLFLVFLAVLEPPAPPRVPTWEVRLLAAPEPFGAIEAAGSLWDHRLRLEAGVRGGTRNKWAEGAVLVRALGSASEGLFVRGGYFIQRFQCLDEANNDGMAFDVGVAYRRRWPGGSLFAAEVGGAVFWHTSRLFCADTLFSELSGGPRISLAGQYSLTPWLGIYGRAGVRFGDHLGEIPLLPELWLGLAFEF